MLSGLLELLVCFHHVVSSSPHVIVEPVKLLPLVLNLDIDILGNIVNVSHYIFDLLNLDSSLLDDRGHVVDFGNYFDVLVILDAHLLLLGSLELAVSEALTLAVRGQLQVVLLLFFDLLSCLVEAVGQLFHLRLESILAFTLKFLNHDKSFEINRTLTV